MIKNREYHLKKLLMSVLNTMFESIINFYSKLTKTVFNDDFVVQLINCEPFTSIYSELDKFCKQLIKDNLISGYIIKYK